MFSAPESGKQAKRIGTCGLCLRLAELQDSHLLPRALYKRALDQGAKNPHPLFYCADGEWQTSSQARRHLLCACCEQRFNRNGENWMLRHAPTSPGTFPLRDILLAHAAFKITDELYCFHADAIREIDADAIGYFALSVIWRAGVCDWPIAGRTVPQLQLGPYAEPLRSYLSDQTDLPGGIAVEVYVSSASEVHMILNMPQTRRWGEYRTHFFDIPGISFMVNVGRRIPPHARETCIVRGVRRPLMYTSVAELANVRDYAELRRSRAT